MSNKIYHYFLFGKKYDGDIYIKADKLEPNGFVCFADPDYKYKLDIHNTNENTIKIQVCNENFPEIREEPPENENKKLYEYNMLCYVCFAPTIILIKFLFL
jgi:hypothetical protein